MFDKFKFEHGLAWFFWVIIILGIMVAVLIFVMFPHLVNVLHGFGFEPTDSTKDSLFWLIFSTLFILALRGAKITYKIDNKTY